MKRLFFLLSIFILINSCKPQPDDLTAATDEDWAKKDLEPKAVEIIEVSSGKLTPFIERSGQLQGIHEVNIISKAQGDIIAMPVKLGDYVKAGSTLLQVDDSLMLFNLKAAEEQWKTASLNYEALANSVGQGGSSRRDLATAASSLASSKAALEQAKRNYQWCRIEAPISGYISRLGNNLSPGNGITQGVNVATIVDNSAWLVSIYLGEREIGLLELGTEVAVTIPAVEEVTYGELYAIAAGSDITTGSYQVQIKLKNGNPRLKSGMTATLLLTSNEPSDRIIIPSSSIIHREGSHYVFLEENEMAKAVEIEVEESLGGRSALSKGLKQGDRLIISAMKQLSPNYPVIPVLVNPEEQP